MSVQEQDSIVLTSTEAEALRVVAAYKGITVKPDVGIADPGARRVERNMRLAGFIAARIANPAISTGEVLEALTRLWQLETVEDDGVTVRLTAQPSPKPTRRKPVSSGRTEAVSPRRGRQCQRW